MPDNESGPFRRWTAVSFGDLEMTCVFSIDPSILVPNMQLNGASGAAQGGTNEEKVSRYRKLWTGQQSTAQIDGTLLPILDSPVPPTSGVFAWWDRNSLQDDDTAAMLIVDHNGHPFITGEICK